MKFTAFDIETADADTMFSAGPEFIRLAGWMTDDGPRTTSDIRGEFIPALDQAQYVHAHNGFGFDALALAYHFPDIVNWEELSAKLLDTMVLERLRRPPNADVVGKGKKQKYDLDTCCTIHGVGGKTNDIRQLAKIHGGYDSIPVDDPAYVEYLIGDVMAQDALFNDLTRTRYAKREHEAESWMGRMTLNGLRVDIPLLNERIAEGDENKAYALNALDRDYGLPMGRFETKGRGNNKVENWEPATSPLSTLEGRQWMIEVYRAFGIPNPPITDTGRISTKAEVLRGLINDDILHPELVEILNLIMTVTTTRTVYQTIDDHLVGDMVHARINMGQASGRSSVTKPGITVMGKRGMRFHERDVFLADPGQSFFMCDLSQIDMRAIAALCGDQNYAALFAAGRDPHTETAIRFFGDASYREKAKPLTHGSNYGLGQKKLIDAGHDPDLVRRYFAERKAQFKVLMRWQDEQRAIGKDTGFITGGFGRRMRVDKNRYYTQSPALMGQNGAAEVLKECLLRLPAELRPFTRMMVHDEIDFSAPTKDVKEIMHEVKKAMTFGLGNDNGKLVITEFGEPGSVPIECDLSGPGQSWGGVIGDSK
ncbi:MAG: DNA polymerase [Candidatus Saccharimonadales bacterium]